MAKVNSARNPHKKPRYSQREIASLVSLRCRKPCTKIVEYDSLMFKVVIHWEFPFKQKRSFSFSFYAQLSMFNYPSQMEQLCSLLGPCSLMLGLYFPEEPAEIVLRSCTKKTLLRPVEFVVFILFQSPLFSSFSI
jgi:hypothetical protein